MLFSLLAVSSIDPPVHKHSSSPPTILPGLMDLSLLHEVPAIPGRKTPPDSHGFYPGATWLPFPPGLCLSHAASLRAWHTQYSSVKLQAALTGADGSHTPS